MKNYELEATIYAERYGIIDYTLEGSVMTWTETFPTEGTFTHTKDFEEEDDYIDDEGGVIEGAALDPDAPEHTCFHCDADITTGGYVAEWADAYCSRAHALADGLCHSDIVEGLEDGTFFWTDWLNVWI